MIGYPAKLLEILLTPLAAFLLAGMLFGLQRRLAARLQSRLGPPLWQPFLDLAKLLAKESRLTNPWLAVCPRLQLAAATVALVLFVLRSDLLVILFVHMAGGSFLVVGGLGSTSPYSQCAGQRQLWQMFAAETILFLLAAALYMTTGSFGLEPLYTLQQPLLLRLPLMFAAYLVALAIKMRKSPFDFAGADHSHQELVGGVLTDYSGRHLALAEVAHWFEVVLYLAFGTLFWTTDFAGGLLLALASFLTVNLLDNSTARLTWRWLLTRSWLAAVSLAVLNLLLLGV
ncbi:MAG: NADH-quinone oxidoreductase subunit H [Deltaproteobacteria bacterium]